jgi:hypothetical protein
MPTVDDAAALLTHPYVWRWLKGPDGEVRKGQRCRVIGSLPGATTCRVEFEDGFRCFAPRSALRQGRRVDASEYPARPGLAGGEEAGAEEEWGAGRQDHGRP